MTRTKNQRKGDAGEEISIARDTIWNNYDVKRTPKNNKGYDYQRRKSKLFWGWRKMARKSRWEYVEVKTGKARQTKSQKEFEKEVRNKGGKYTVERINPFF